MSNGYTYKNHTFSEAEIDQFVALVEAWSSGQAMPLDGRKYSKAVLDCAYAAGLVAQGSDVPEYQHRYYRNGRGTWGKVDAKRWYTLSSAAYWYDFVPAQVLWRLVKPIIESAAGYSDRTAGYSVARARGWLKLNIYPAGHRMTVRDEATLADSERHISNVLARLDQWGFIWFRTAGSIWNVRIR